MKLIYLSMNDAHNTMVSSRDIKLFPYGTFKGNDDIVILIQMCFMAVYNVIASTLEAILFVSCFLVKKLFYLWDWSMEKLQRKRIILDRDGKDPYLVRYYVLFKDRKDFPFNIFIHHILKSDDEDLHDHPWGFYTFMLHGGYYETTLTGDDCDKRVTTWYPRWSWRKMESNHVHRITLDHKKAGECWTLFIPFRREKEWGFLKKKEEKITGPVTRSQAAAAAVAANKKQSRKNKESFDWIPSDTYLKNKAT